MGNESTFLRSLDAKQRALLALAIVLVIALAAAIGAFLGYSHSTGDDGAEAMRATESSLVSDGQDTTTPVEQGADGSHARSHGEYELDAKQLLALPDDVEVTAIDLSSAQDPAVLSEAQKQSVESQVAAIQESGPCGFVFLDVDSGHGLVYNAGESMYVASAAKEVLAEYALENGAGADGWTRGSIEAAIVDSDNGAYESFGYRYFDDGYISMLADHDVQAMSFAGDLYPSMSARSLASLWAETLQYVRGGSEDAMWLWGLLGSTSTSYIRDAIGGEGVAVMNKAGWIADWEVNSVTDAGIVQQGERTFLMVIVTGAPAWGDAEEHVTGLARALFELRDVI